MPDCEVIPFPAKKAAPPEPETKRIRPRWWIARVPGAAFFGQSYKEVMRKYDDWVQGKTTPDALSDRVADKIIDLARVRPASLRGGEFNDDR